MEFLFSYGTLQDPNVQLKLFGREVDSVPDVMTGYEAQPVILGNETHRLAVERKDGEIPGTVLALFSNEIAICDAYEPKEYRREQVRLLSGKAAWAYVAAKN